jgi:hypothetical protein
LQEIWALHGRLIAVLLLVLVLGGAAAGIGVARSRPQPQEPGPVDQKTAQASEGSERPNEVQSLNSQVQQAAEEGDWQKVDDLIFRARKQGEKDARFAPLVKELTTPLQVDCKLHMVVPRGRAAAESGVTVLTRGDEYWLQLAFSSRCHLYVFEQGPAGQLRVLFPESRYSSLGNPVDQAARLPEDYSKPFVVEADEPGLHTIHVLASRWPQRRVEALIAQGVQAGTPEILALLNAAKEHTSSIGGLSYGVYQFQQGAASRVGDRGSRSGGPRDSQGNI